MAKDTKEAPAIPLAPAAPAPLTKEELETGSRLFQTKVDEFLSEEEKLLHGVLLLNWNKGNFCIDLKQDPARYGNNGPTELAAALDCSEQSVHLYVKFSTQYTRDKVGELAAKHVPWRSVTSLLTVSSPEKREKLEQLVTHDDPEKRLTSDELQNKVKEINSKEKKAARAKGQHVSDRGGARPIVIVRSFSSLCEDLISKQEDFKTAYMDWRNMEEGQSKDDTAAALKAAFIQAKKVCENMQKLEDLRIRMSKKDK